MIASLIHFCNVVDRIESNSWWSDNFGPGKTHHTGFTYSDSSDGQSITHVPTEPLESLLLHVRKLTMNDGPENLHKVRKALKAVATEVDQQVLDVWHKYWRLALIKDPFEVECSGGKHVMTPYRVYDCFINGELFHSNDPKYNVILHGSPQPAAIKTPNLFLRNVFHSAVTNLCFAALGLKRYIDNGCTFTDFTMFPGNHPVTVEFILRRKQADQMDEQYRAFSEWVRANGGTDRCYWT